MLPLKSMRQLWLFFVFCNSLFSQMFSMPRQQQQPVIIWGDKHLAVIDKFGTKVTIGDLSHAGFFREFLARPSTLGVSVGHDRIIDVRLINQKFYVGFLPFKGNVEDFEIETGQDPQQRGFPIRLYETDRPELFFGINVDTGFIKDNEASNCAWWRRTDRGSLRLDKIIPIKWADNSALLPLRNNGKPVYAAQSMALPGLFPFLDAPIRVPGAFILVSWKSGILWVIKDGSDSPSKTINLIDINNDFITGKHPFPSVILGIQPLQNGKILVARRSRSAIFNTYKSFNIETQKNNPQPSEYRLADAEQNVATIVYPEIEWVEVTPLTGEVNHFDDSLVASAPLVLKSVNDISRFTFGFDPSGRLVLPWVIPQIQEPIPVKPPNCINTPGSHFFHHKNTE